MGKNKQKIIDEQLIYHQQYLIPLHKENIPIPLSTNRAVADTQGGVCRRQADARLVGHNDDARRADANQVSARAGESDPGGEETGRRNCHCDSPS